MKQLGSIPSKRSEGYSSRDGAIWRQKVQYSCSGYRASVKSMQTNKLREQGSNGNSIENNEGDTMGAKLLYSDETEEGSGTYYLSS